MILEKKIEYVYLLQEREFIRLDEPVYKIGRTTQVNLIRFNQYPNGSTLLFQTICNDCVSIETKIKTLFKLKYKQMIEYGDEYFEGDFRSMIWDIISCVDINNLKVNVKSEAKEPTITKTCEKVVEIERKMSVRGRPFKNGNYMEKRGIILAKLNELLGIKDGKNSFVLKDLEDKRDKILEMVDDIRSAFNYSLWSYFINKGRPGFISLVKSV